MYVFRPKSTNKVPMKSVPCDNTWNLSCRWNIVYMKVRISSGMESEYVRKLACEFLTCTSSDFTPERGWYSLFERVVCCFNDIWSVTTFDVMYEHTFSFVAKSLNQTEGHKQNG